MTHLCVKHKLHSVFKQNIRQNRVAFYQPKIAPIKTRAREKMLFALMLRSIFNEIFCVFVESIEVSSSLDTTN